MMVMMIVMMIMMVLIRAVMMIQFNSIQFNFYFDFVNIYMIEIHHWPANSTELIEASQWLQLIYISTFLYMSKLYIFCC